MKYKFVMACVSLSAILSCTPVCASEQNEEVSDPDITESVKEAESEEQSIGEEASNGQTVDGKEDDLSASNGLSVMDTNLDSLFASMQDSLLSGEDVSISDAFNSLSKQEISQDSLFDLSDVLTDASFDSGLLNIQYAAMTESMMDSSGLKNVSGQSMNCMQLFNDTYGDIMSQIQLEEPTIPEGFTVESMLQAGQEAVQQAYASVTSSGDFATVKNSISIGNIFSIANEGLTMPDLASGETLSGMLGSLSESSGNKSSIKKEYSAYDGELGTIKEDFSHDMVSNTKGKLLEMADIANPSLLYSEEDESYEGNVSEHLDSLRHARRNNSLIGKGINLITDTIDGIADVLKEAGSNVGSKIYNFVNDAMEKSEENGDLDWSKNGNMTFPR